ncbi:hypothetical protein [Hymenobacter sp. YC55]|uniref:hypothetical protein n=1 Tax=Hymenobacter sp. YC55 TaxID=3034019 RepID=UPI0023F8B78B|nr:hypothetical protein [Hymenobacter sp. YC55]MDF7814145.1 hypothetical protein [Hymenobacter sp. YC55]
MSTKKSSVTILSEFRGKHYGPRGVVKGEALETGYENFKKANAGAVEAPAALDLSALFGAYFSSESADEILARIRSSRVYTRGDTSLDC